MKIKISPTSKKIVKQVATATGKGIVAVLYIAGLAVIGAAHVALAQHAARRNVIGLLPDEWMPPSIH